MPSLRSQIVKEQIRLIKPLMSKTSISAARAGQRKYGELGERVTASKVKTALVKFSDFNCRFITPTDCDEKNVVLYLHGGGYVAGDIKYASGFGSILAVATGFKVLCAAYRLAPEHPYPAAVEDCLCAYKYLLSNGYSNDNIFLAGESAGGGLVYSLCLLLKQEGIALPKAIVAISPWTDLACSGDSFDRNKKLDPSLFEHALHEYARLYAPGRLHDPLVSPLLGELEGMPDSLIIVGSDEILLDDAVRMSEKLSAAGCSASLEIGEGLWHVYPLFSLPESEEALKRISRFLNGYVESSPVID